MSIQTDTTAPSLLPPDEHVLSTLERDGSRRWLKPKLSRGQWLWRRRLAAYALVALFVALPFVKIGSKPFILLDIAERKFTIFGFTFLPTDTVLLALFLVGTILSIFLITALFGRVWCGWGCPQTVYLEFFYRPVERFFDGTAGKGGQPKATRPTWFRMLKYPVYLVLSFLLANLFLSYFVGVNRLWEWMHQSPATHPAPFLVMAFVTIAMMADFTYFREQVCIIMCPYGRFQSVLLDQSSVIVSYDARRGEPRGKAKLKAASAGPASLPVLGDCVDCGLCVATCPTGIDIRKGLQMECINCTQCIDACNQVMSKLGRAPDLIRYSSQKNDRGEPNRIARARVFLYPLLLSGIAGLFFFFLTARQSFNIEVLRDRGNPFTVTEDQKSARNLLLLKLTNRTDEPSTYTLKVLSPPVVELKLSEPEMTLAPGEARTFHVSAVAPLESFRDGRAKLEFEVRNREGVVKPASWTLIGPR